MAPDPRLSEAVIVFLGRGQTPYPKRDPARVVDHFGDRDGLDLVVDVEAVLRELYELEPDWTTDDLASATAKAVDRVRAAHPQLSDEALDALRWSFSWDWK